MPRLNLTEEEAVFIEARRKKNAEDIAFNQGVIEASKLTRSFLTSKHVASNLVDECCNVLAAARRSIKL